MIVCSVNKMLKIYAKSPIIESNIWSSIEKCTLWNSDLNPKAKEFIPKTPKSI
jgi:hypothetical protein